jgi:Glycosyl transferase family 2
MLATGSALSRLQMPAAAQQNIVDMHDLGTTATQFSTDPLITVAIPTYNRIQWLKGCIFAVFAQRLERFELIVSNNASTDETSAFLSTISDPRLRVLTQTSNIGAIRNLNACLAAANGEYIVFVPDDDRIAPEFLYRCTDLIRRDPHINVALGLCDTLVISRDDPRGELRSASPSTTLDTGIWDGTDILLELLRDRITKMMCTTLIRAEALRARGGFPITLPYSGDLAAWFPILLTGKSAFINESCGTMTLHNANFSSEQTLDLLDTDFRAAMLLIAAETDRSNHPLAKRKRIKLEIKRHVANVTIHNIIDICAEGKPSRRMIPFVWKHIQLIAPGDTHRLIILLCFLFFPAQVATVLRDLTFSTRAALATIPGTKNIYRRLTRHY